MHDAVALANWICALHPKKPDDINFVFTEYYEERFPIAKDTFSNSQKYSKLAGKVTWCLFLNVEAMLIRSKSH